MIGDVAKLDMFNISNPVVGDVAKLDMLLKLPIQWLVMWQSWICFHSNYSNLVVGDVAKLDMLNISTYMAYPVVGDVTKLDIRLYAFHGLFVLMR